MSNHKKLWNCYECGGKIINSKRYESVIVNNEECRLCFNCVRNKYLLVYKWGIKK